MTGISVIIPTFNEARYVRQCIQSVRSALEHCIYKEYEIIVVDNMSTDDTQEIIRSEGLTPIISTKKGNPGASRNLGAKQAQYDTLCFIDGDCLVSTDWFNHIIEAFNNADVAAYGGPILSPENGNWIETTWAPVKINRSRSDYSALAGANFSVRHHIFDQLGGFNESLETAEDDDLSKRILAKGYKIISTSEHTVIHLGYPKTLREIIAKQIWHGRSQLKAHGILGDKVVTMTIVWIAAFICAVLFSASLPAVSLLAATMVLSLPLLLAIKRLQKFSQKSLATYLRAYVICWAFLIGRSIGMFNEIVGKN